jgi:hypothetical protein
MCLAIYTGTVGQGMQCLKEWEGLNVPIVLHDTLLFLLYFKTKIMIMDTSKM